MDAEDPRVVRAPDRAGEVVGETFAGRAHPDQLRKAAAALLAAAAKADGKPYRVVWHAVGEEPRLGWAPELPEQLRVSILAEMIAVRKAVDAEGGLEFADELVGRHEETVSASEIAELSGIDPRVVAAAMFNNEDEGFVRRAESEDEDADG